MGISEEIAESARVASTGDDFFLRTSSGGPDPLLYFFELEVPASVGNNLGEGGGNYFIFPLALAPTALSWEEPFAVEKTQSQGGGLFLEENGIIDRVLRIQGHTGFRPRDLKASPGIVTMSQQVENKTFDRWFDMVPKVKYSGQRHFQFLQDAVFRTYADLKQDPSTSEETRMYWHNMRDEEHWQVVPQMFRMERNVGDRTRLIYAYDIRLIVVGQATAVDADFSEDKGWLDAVKDALRAVNSAIQTLSAVIRELTGLVAELKSFVTNIGKIVDSLIAIVRAATDYANGVSNAIDVSIRKVDDTISQVDGAISDFEAATVGAAIDAIKASMQSARDGLNRLRTHPELFQTDDNKRLELIKRGQEYSTGNETRLQEAQAANLDSVRKWAAMGTANMPGDLERAKAELGIGRAIQRFSSAVSVAVESGDTLPNLAQRYLGDARQWRAIAVVNSLQFPYISEQGQPGTVKIGDPILIPSTKKSQQAQALTPILGVDPQEPAVTRFLGTDFALVDVSPTGRLQKQFDVPIDTEGGSTDVKTVTGIENLRQAMLVRLTTERGGDPLYRKLGRKRTVGVGLAPLDRNIIAFRVAEAVVVDPRIVSTVNVRLRPTSADAISVEFDAQVRGFADPLNLSLEV